MSEQALNEYERSPKGRKKNAKIVRQNWIMQQNQLKRQKLRGYYVDDDDDLPTLTRMSTEEIKELKQNESRIDNDEDEDIDILTGLSTEEIKELQNKDNLKRKRSDSDDWYSDSDDESDVSDSETKTERPKHKKMKQVKTKLIPVIKIRQSTLGLDVMDATELIKESIKEPIAGYANEFKFNVEYDFKQASLNNIFSKLVDSVCGTVLKKFIYSVKLIIYGTLRDTETGEVMDHTCILSC